MRSCVHRRLSATSSTCLGRTSTRGPQRATLRAPNGTYYFCEGCQRMWYQDALPGTSDMSDEQYKLLRRLRQIFGDPTRSSLFC